jgi:hypothetical protein
MRRAADDLRINLLMAMCPNLEKVTTDVNHMFRFDFLKPGTLPRLKDVLLTNVDTGSCTKPSEMNRLFHAAPSIESFTAHRPLRVVPMLMALANLRHLGLEQSYMPASCLDVVLMSCPQLESFAYGMPAPHRVTISQVMKIMLRHVPQVKHLDLDISDPGDGEEEEEEQEAEDRLYWDEYASPAPGFASFSQLETLVVSGPALWDEWYDEPAATLFPQSLRTLSLVVGFVPPNLAGVPMQEFTGVPVEEFVSAARNALPNLKSITSLENRVASPVEHLSVS